MFGLFRRRKNVQPMPSYIDAYDTMLYQAPEGVQARALPTIYAFRVKEGVWSPDPRPDFVFLETDAEVQEWQQALAGPVTLNADGHITDAPLLRWNDIPSLLTADDELIATYFPVQDGKGWPTLVLQAHPFGAVLNIKPARDRYYFQQNIVVGAL